MSEAPVRPWLRAGVTALVAGGAAAAVAGAAASALATAFARGVVRPVAERPDDVEVLAVTETTVELSADPQTRAPGRYALVLGGGTQVAHVGDVLGEGRGGRTRRVAATGKDRPTVVRELLDVPPGGLRPGPARWSGWYHAGDPTSALGLPHEDVVLTAPSGTLPAWYVPPSREGAATDAGGAVWAVLVHGRGATREECLRALPVLHRLGVPSLVPTYRNDEGGPQSLAKSYSLGDTEWEDVEAAVLHALDHGAADVVLMGWSMGGAIALQHVTRSWTAGRVRALVLDSPVVDWRDVLAHAAHERRIPRAVGRLGTAMIAASAARHLVGVEAPVDLTRLDWVGRAAELRLPVLLLHAAEDDVVPIGPSRRLARARPDLVTLEEFPGALHTKEWNTDPGRWEREVARFLLQHL